MSHFSSKIGANSVALELLVLVMLLFDIYDSDVITIHEICGGKGFWHGEMEHNHYHLRLRMYLTV